MSEETFCCGFCGAPNPERYPFVIKLDDNEQYGYEDPYGGWVWVTEEEEEGYMCHVCGNHISPEECYWGDPYEEDER